jgi:hypothetical protein
MSSGHQELSEESSEILPERPQKCRSMDRHRGQVAVLKQMSELIQTNESQRKQRQSVQDFPATGSEDRIISVRIMGASVVNFNERITHQVLLEVLSRMPYCQC